MFVLVKFVLSSVFLGSGFGFLYFLYSWCVRCCVVIRSIDDVMLNGVIFMFIRWVSVVGVLLVCSVENIR